MADFTLPSNKLISWTPGVAMGVIGGIPTRTNLINVTLAPYFADNTGVVDCAAALQAAIDAATTNDVIYLPAGTYKVSTQLNFGSTKNNRSFRGDGIGKTIIVNVDTNANNSVFFVGTSSEYVNALNYPWAYPTASNTVTGGLTKDSTVLTIADTSAFVTGTILQITNADQQTTSAITGGATPVVNVWGYPGNRRQKTKLVSKTGTTLTIFPPLYWDSTQMETKVYTARTQTNGVGIEGITIDLTNNSTIKVGILFEQCFGCWIKGVEIKLAYNYPIFLWDCLNCEVRESFVNQIQNPNGTNGSGVLIIACCACYVENNALYKCFPHFEINYGSAGNVFGYNYCNDSTVFGVIGSSINTNHGPHNSFNLFEGNIAPNFESDGFFGGSSDDVFFRNWFHGTSTTGSPPRSPVLIKRMAYGYSLVGNQLGTSGVNAPTYNIGFPYIGDDITFVGYAGPSTGNFWADFNISGSLDIRNVNGSGGSITLSGGFGDLTSGQYVNLSWSGSAGMQTLAQIVTISGNNPKKISFVGDISSFTNSIVLPSIGEGIRVWVGPIGFEEKDLDVSGKLTLKGNYCTQNTGIPSNEAWGGSTISGSWYLTSKPSWFGFLAWPPFDSTNPNFNTGSIPAAYRFIYGVDPFFTLKRLGSHPKFVGSSF